MHAAKLGAPLLLAAVASACPGRPQAPRVPPAADQTLPIEGSLRAVAGDGATVFALVEASKATSVQALRGGTALWRAPLTGAATPALALGGSLVAAAVSANSEQGV